MRPDSARRNWSIPTSRQSGNCDSQTCRSIRFSDTLAEPTWHEDLTAEPGNSLQFFANNSACSSHAIMLCIVGVAGNN